MKRLNETLVKIGFDPSDANAIAGKFLKDIARDLGPTATVEKVFTENDLHQRFLKVAARYLRRLPQRKQDELGLAIRQEWQRSPPRFDPGRALFWGTTLGTAAPADYSPAKRANDAETVSAISDRGATSLSTSGADSSR
jgi:hypothetical protein